MATESGGHVHDGLHIDTMRYKSVPEAKYKKQDRKAND